MISYLLANWLVPFLLLLTFLAGAGISGVNPVSKAIKQYRKPKPQIESKPKNMFCGCGHHRSFHDENGCAGPLYAKDGALETRLCSCRGYISSMQMEEITLDPMPVRIDNHPSLGDRPGTKEIEAPKSDPTEASTRQSANGKGSTHPGVSPKRDGDGITGDITEIYGRGGKRL